MFIIVKKMCSLHASLTVTILLSGLPSNLATPETSLDFANISWPPECEGRSYCHVRPSNYPQSKFDELLEGAEFITKSVPNLDQRIGIVNDVADCQPKLKSSDIYLIKDESNKVRLVAHTDHFKYRILTEECVEPGEITKGEFQNQDIHCYETKVSLLFSVLSSDGSGLESAGPSGGIPFSCSAKKMRKVV